MRYRRTILITSCATSAVAVILMGFGLGTMYGRQRAEGRRASYQARLYDYLKDSIVGIEVGKPFPDMVVWAPSGVAASRIRDVLPEGGVIVLLSPGCASCVDVVQSVHEAMGLAGNQARKAIVVTDRQEKTEMLLSAMADRQIHVPVYCDIEETLRRKYHVVANPVYFCIAEDGSVESVS